MPLYQYKCTKGHEFTKQYNIADHISNPQCTEKSCRAKGKQQFGNFNTTQMPTGAGTRMGRGK